MRFVQGTVLAAVGLGCLCPAGASAAILPAACTGTTGNTASLVAAIDAANDEGTNPGPDTVSLGAGCTYVITVRENSWYGPTGLPAIASDITIEGNGAAIARDPNGLFSFRLFFVGADPASPSTPNYFTPGAGKLTLREVTLRDGLARGGSASGGGGAAGMGGAIFNQGTLVIERSTLTANTAEGGSGAAGDDGGGGGIGGNAGATTGGAFSGSNSVTVSPFGGGDGAGPTLDVSGGFGGGGFAPADDAVDPPDTGPGSKGGGATTGTGAAGGNANGGAGGNGSGGGGGAASGLSAEGGRGGGAGSGASQGLEGANGSGIGAGGQEGGAGGGGGVGGGGGAGSPGGTPGQLGIGGRGGAGGGGGFGAGGGPGGAGGGSGNSGADSGAGGEGGDGGFGGGAGAGGLKGPNPFPSGTRATAGSPGFGGGNADGARGGGGAGMGGAIFNMQGSVTIRNSTLAGNTATGGGPLDAPDPGKGIGGAVFNMSGTLDVDASTLAGNAAAYGGSAIYNISYDGQTARNGTTTLRNTILFGGTGAKDLTSIETAYISVANLGDAVASVGERNIVGASEAVEQGQIQGTALTGNPLLGALANNGGPTQTMLPAATGPAIDAGSAFGLTTDQRGLPRPFDVPAVANFGDAADIGAVERQASDPGGGGGPGAFGANTLITLSLAAKRIRAKGPVPVRVRNGNGFEVTGSLAGRRNRTRLRAKRFTVGANARTTVRLKLPKKLRRVLKRKKKLALRLTASVRDPAGNSRRVTKKVTPKLKRKRRR